jgi:cobalt-zinc-cadmium efflux system outer membrane protein
MRAFWLFACSMLVASVTHAAPLTYQAALTLADQTAPGLQAKALGVRAARSTAIAAGRLPDPKLEFGVEGLPISGPFAGHPDRDDFSDTRLGVMQEVPNGAKRQAQRDRAAADIGAAEVSQTAQAREVRLGAALAWIDLYYAERRLVALDDINQTLAKLRAAAPSQLVSGALRPSQTLQPEQLIAALDDRRADLVAAVATARAELERWTGDSPAEVAGDPPDYAIDPAALRAGVDQLPTLTSYDAMGRQADADVDAAKADRHSDWSWELAWQHRAPRFGDMVMVQATVSLPLFASTRQDPIIAAREETANGVRLDREAARRELLAALDTSLADHAMHHDRLHRALGTLVPLAKRRAELETASYAAGTASLSDVLDAELSLAEAVTDALDRQADVAKDGARILLTYGIDTQ